MRIVIDVIPHKRQRYPTVGDWFWKRSTLHIRVSKLSTPYRSMLVAIHELFEALWALRNEVPQKDVDAFDIAYEKNRAEGDTSEPGDDKTCPVYKAHQIATAIERIACVGLGEDWRDYDEEVEQL